MFELLCLAFLLILAVLWMCSARTARKSNSAPMARPSLPRQVQSTSTKKNPQMVKPSSPPPSPPADMPPLQRRTSGMSTFDEFKPDAYREYLQKHSDAEIVRQYKSKAKKLGWNSASLAADAVMLVATSHVPVLLPLTLRNRSVNNQKMAVIRAQVAARNLMITESGWYRRG